MQRLLWWGGYWGLTWAELGNIEVFSVFSFYQLWCHPMAWLHCHGFWQYIRIGILGINVLTKYWVCKNLELTKVIIPAGRPSTQNPVQKILYVAHNNNIFQKPTPLWYFIFSFRFGITYLLVTDTLKVFVSLQILVYAWRTLLARTPVTAPGAQACGVLGVIIKTSPAGN